MVSGKLGFQRILSRFLHKIQKAFIHNQKDSQFPAVTEHTEQKLPFCENSRRIIGIAEEHHIQIFMKASDKVLLDAESIFFFQIHMLHLTACTQKGLLILGKRRRGNKCPLWLHSLA